MCGTKLESRGIRSEIVEDPTRPTTVKTRYYLSDGKKTAQCKRVSRPQTLSRHRASKCCRIWNRPPRRADAIMICDFSYGVVTQPMLEMLADNRWASEASRWSAMCRPVRRWGIAPGSRRSPWRLLRNAKRGSHCATAKAAIADLGVMLPGADETTVR